MRSPERAWARASVVSSVAGEAVAVQAEVGVEDVHHHGGVGVLEQLFDGDDQWWIAEDPGSPSTS